jgi:hypothetical protein
LDITAIAKINQNRIFQGPKHFVNVVRNIGHFKMKLLKFGETYIVINKIISVGKMLGTKLDPRIFIMAGEIQYTESYENEILRDKAFDGIVSRLRYGINKSDK